MFRRKDELMDDEFSSEQGSLLQSDIDNTVNVLTPEKAAEYKAEKASSDVSAPKAPSTQSQPQSQSASFSSPSSYGQTARPIQKPAASPEQVTPRPANVNANNTSSYTPSTTQSNSFRPAPSDASRFRSPSEAPRQVSTPSPSTYNSESHTMLNKHNQNERTLTVGNDILLKGEITACDRLVIEGNVDATVSEVHTMELTSAGSFKGNAEVEYAEISGDFVGNLVVHSSLVIHKTGKVSGNITYGEIEIARGGTITGEIKAIQSGTQVNITSQKKEEKAAA